MLFQSSNSLIIIVSTYLFADKGVCTIPHVEGVLRMEEERAWQEVHGSQSQEAIEREPLHCESGESK